MPHYFECGICRHKFSTNDDTDYNDAPQERDCPSCRNAKGQILYYGSGKPGFYVVKDDLGMAGVRNEVDGKHYDSKSELRKSYKDHGVIEVGNEPLPTKPREQLGNYDCRADIARAMEQIGFDNKRRKK